MGVGVRERQRAEGRGGGWNKTVGFLCECV